MKNEKFKKLLKEKEPKKIIALYTARIINLTNKQLDLVLKKKEGK